MLEKMGTDKHEEPSQHFLRFLNMRLLSLKNVFLEILEYAIIVFKKREMTILKILNKGSRSFKKHKMEMW